MTHSAETRLIASWPPIAWRDVSVLLAVSGGPDSVALLRAMAAIRAKEQGVGRLVVAHFNHRLRGEPSDADEHFVVELARSLELPCTIQRSPVSEKISQSVLISNDCSEATARRLRYDFLHEASSQWGARYVATAHTADDQAETILHRVVRGTGMGGLAGIPRVRQLSPAATLIRPMLNFRRQELLDYLDTLEQDYRIDESNSDVRFTRNRIRHRLLPELAEHYNPAVVDAIVRLGRMADEVQSVVGAIVKDLIPHTVIEECPESVRLDTTVLNDHPRHLVRELLIAIWRRRGWSEQSMGFDEWDQIATMVFTGSGKQVFPGQVMVCVDSGSLQLERRCLPDRLPPE